jgi:hypothetical protein
MAFPERIEVAVEPARRHNGEVVQVSVIRRGDDAETAERERGERSRKVIAGRPTANRRRGEACLLAIAIPDGDGSTAVTE